MTDKDNKITPEKVPWLLDFAKALESQANEIPEERESSKEYASNFACLAKQYAALAKAYLAKCEEVDDSNADAVQWEKTAKGWYQENQRLQGIIEEQRKVLEIIHKWAQEKYDERKSPYCEMPMGVIDTFRIISIKSEETLALTATDKEE